ncbi:MAG: hypothetical protein ABI200_03515 [Gaiellales bacterium]
MADGHVIDNEQQRDEDGASPDGVRDERGVLRRVSLFLIERFPPGPQLVLLVVLFIAATLMSGLLLAPDVGGTLGNIEPLPAVCAFIGSLLFIVRLRLYDDVKDADTDRVENPTRPIPRGLVSVRELDVVGVLVLVIEGALIAVVGPLTFTAWAIAAAWSVLMRVEFFVSSWIEPRVALYAISHMVVMGLIYGQLLSIGIEARGGSASIGELYSSTEAVVAMLAATSIGIGFEWGRKFERYFAAHGEWGWLWWMAWPCIGAITFTALVRNDYPIWSVAALTAVSIVAIFGHALIMGQRSHPPAPGERGDVPTGGMRAIVDAAPGLTGLIVYLLLAVAGIVELIK